MLTTDPAAPRLAVVADDLTGALDAAAPFAGRGLKVELATDPAAIAQAVADGAEVIAITTASREIPAADATAAVRAAIAALPAGTRIFKKVDSRLKGNIAAELSAIDYHRALVAPAIPEFGRVVQGGAVSGFGVEYPIPIADVLGPHAARADIPDTPTVEALAHALDHSPADLIVGARGIADALARAMTDRDNQPVPKLPGPRAIFVVGSRDPITLSQVALLRDQGRVAYLGAPNGRFVWNAPNADLCLVQALPGEVEIAGPQVAAALAQGLGPALAQGCDTLLLTGGATAEAVLLALGITRMTVVGECLPGLAVARAGGLTIVAKSGGFGGPDTLLRIAAMIEGSKQWA